VALERRELRRTWWPSHDARAAILFLLPFLVAYLVLKLWPIAYGFWISLHKWSSIGGEPTLVGLQNYQRLLADPLFWRAFGNTVIFAALATPSLIALGMGLALILNRKLPGGSVFRTLFYMPNMLSVSVISLIFVAVLTGDSSGLINNFLGLFGVQPDELREPLLIEAGRHLIFGLTLGIVYPLLLRRGPEPAPTADRPLEAPA
jgi:ABC-type sugar transport system permease subunit